MPQHGWFLTWDIPAAALLLRHGPFPKCLGAGSDMHGCDKRVQPPSPCDAHLVLHLCLNLPRLPADGADAACSRLGVGRAPPTLEVLG